MLRIVKSYQIKLFILLASFASFLRWINQHLTNQRRFLLCLTRFLVRQRHLSLKLLLFLSWNLSLSCLVLTWIVLFTSLLQLPERYQRYRQPQSLSFLLLFSCVCLLFSSTRDSSLSFLTLYRSIGLLFHLFTNIFDRKFTLCLLIFLLFYLIIGRRLLLLLLISSVRVSLFVFF